MTGLIDRIKKVSAWTTEDGRLFSTSIEAEAAQIRSDIGLWCSRELPSQLWPDDVSDDVYKIILEDIDGGRELLRLIGVVGNYLDS